MSSGTDRTVVLYRGAWARFHACAAFVCCSLAFLASALVLLPSTTSADSVQTERRLKAAGVSEALRMEVQVAIDRAVRYLCGHQQESGSFLPAGASSNLDVGTTLLVALALRHAGGAETETPLGHALHFLFDGPPARTAVIERDVYSASLALMLLASDAGPTERAERIARSLCRGLDAKTGWWGYETPGPGNREAPEPLPDYQAQTPNLSTSQFAALGLRAASSLGVHIPREVWVRHATALCRSQLRGGSWMYVPLDERGRPVVPEGLGHRRVLREGYFTGTCMGLANLLLARAALAEAGPEGSSLRARISVSCRRALATMHRDAPVELDDAAVPRVFPLPVPAPGGGAFPPDVKPPAPPARGPPPRPPGWGHFYTLYALEKACLFADLEEVGGKGARRAWYCEGARWLLDRQRQDGGWAAVTEEERWPSYGRQEKPWMEESNPIDTAFALLFLVRSPAVFHPVTPSDVDARPEAAATTPQETDSGKR